MQMIWCLVLLLVGLNLSLDTRGSEDEDEVFSKYDFPDTFVFGAGSSAYQWEGAAEEDGRKPSIWDTFAKTRTGSNGDKTSDGYHKYKEDVELMVETGLDAFRLSISWSRLIPNGRGFVNPKAVMFYRNVINQLISNGIEPHVTLHHSDVPQVLEDEYGGWLDRRMIEDFRAYADVCFREFGDSVKHWTSINAANSFTIAGYAEGTSPPGRCSPGSPHANCSKGNSSIEPYLVVHHLLLAHASVAELYRHKYKDIQQGSLGISIYVYGLFPYTNTKDDVMATQRAKDIYFGWVLDPLMFGEYPDEFKKRVGSRLPVFTEKESKLVKGSIDFIGLLHYSSLYVRNKIYDRSGFYADMAIEKLYIGNATHYQYGVYPWGMEALLDYIKQSYGNPTIYILENGEGTPHTSSLNDRLRVKYIQAYIGAVLNAIRNGADIKGYFVWSLIDMYELLSGYEYSFGLYYVNFSDPFLKRSPKLSAHWYSAFLKGTTIQDKSLSFSE